MLNRTSRIVLAAMIVLQLVAKMLSGQELERIDIGKASSVRIFPSNYALPKMRLESVAAAEKELYPELPNTTGVIGLTSKQAISITLDQMDRLDADLADLAFIPADRLVGLTLLVNRIAKEQVGKLARFPKLTQLTIYCEDVDVPALVMACPRLQMLELYSLDIRPSGEQGAAFSDDTFRNVCKLKELEVFRTMGEKLTDEGISHLVDSPHLKAIEVVRTKQLTNKSFLSLARCRNLREIAIEIDGKLTVPGIEPLADLPNLKLLILNGGERHYAGAAQSLKDKFSKVEILFDPPFPNSKR